MGTHALLYEGAGFTRLGLAVIDEQHKFGVLQRAPPAQPGCRAGRPRNDRHAHPAHADHDALTATST
ncbi:MAG: hypothetical protein WDN28_10685 [Chthoniobacter sp.]